MIIKHHISAQNSLLCDMSTQQGSFRWGTRAWNAVPIVKVLKNAVWTALRTIFWPKCTRLQDFAYTISIFFSGGDTPGPRRSAPRFLDPDTNFRLARQRFHCSYFIFIFIHRKGSTQSIMIIRKHNKNNNNK